MPKPTIRFSQRPYLAHEHPRLQDYYHAFKERATTTVSRKGFNVLRNAMDYLRKNTRNLNNKCNRHLHKIKPLLKKSLNYW